MKGQKNSNRAEDPTIRSMRIRSWVRAVQLASGLTLAQLEDAFSEREPGQKPSNRSCIWGKYERGEVAPRSGCSPKGTPNLIERVELRYPGTAMWLSSPLWRLADKAPMEMSEIREIYEGLPYLLRSIFIAAPHEASEVFWRRPVDTKDVGEILLKPSTQDTVSTLVIALAMVKEAEITQSQYEHWTGVEIVQKCLAMQKQNGVLDGELLSDLYRYLVARLERVEYFSIPEEGEGNP